ncbi:MAG: D-aminoacylase [Kordiimonadaceae bacterium]|nr:D-aminoacylase [Kordiimonadaceae bacterium]MBO6567369.1 D-aminoacylase [Kordiimonadaceae bacterium]MBO6963417.1 D-aminoacylase [Kordiimonadaceae bacterium]
MKRTLLAIFGLMAVAAIAYFQLGVEPVPKYDVIITNGVVYDGSGGGGQQVDIAISDDRIAAVGDLSLATADTYVDASGKAVAPGFINVLSWAVETLIEDGNGESDIRQGVTTEVFGEGVSWGPVKPEMKEYAESRQGDIKYPIEWTTLGGYLEYLENRGVSPNVASFMGATTARVSVLGYENRAPSEEELTKMKALVAEAMEEGALGVGSSLIYAPAAYAETDELIALMQTASEYGGMYISHLRSEGDRFEEAVDELITIARESGAPAEIYHLKAAGTQNWPKMDRVIAKIEAARAEGLAITTDMYSYTAGATGLDAMMPPWVQEGGYEAWAERLKDPLIREQLIVEIATPQAWENLYLAAGGADKLLLIGFKNEALKPLTGKSLAEVAAMRGKGPIETAMDLVIEDGSRVGTAYFIMSEENIRKKIALPYMSFGSDAGAPAPNPPFTLSGAHPRAYGNFARVFAKYVREDGILTVGEAVRKMTSLPAENLKLRERGRLQEGYFADIVIFDPETIQDHSTFDDPHQYSTGVNDVWVNGIQVLKDGDHTGARPGRALRGPGWLGWKETAQTQ